MEPVEDQSDSDALYESIIAELVERDRRAKKPEKKVNKSSKPSTELTKKEEEDRLEMILFGGKTEYVKRLASAVGETLSEEDAGEEKSATLKRKPAWHDSDDEQYLVGDVVRENKRNKFTTQVHGNKTYSEYVRNKFNQVVSEPKWAKLDRKVEPDSDEELLTTVGFLSKSTSQASLPAKTIIAKRLKDLNRDTYAEKCITSVQFHPTSTAALVTGHNGVASIYSIDGKRNEKLHNVFFQGFSIKCAKMLPSGTEVLIGGSKPYGYSYDLVKGEESKIFLPRPLTKMAKFELSPCGKLFAVVGRFGELHLMDLRSKELLRTYKQEYNCSALQFSNDSKKLLTHSEGPEVNIFDLRQERIEHRFLDDGCITGTALKICPNGKMLATGSKEGVVNVYNYDDIFSGSSPRPAKIIYNLTTEISAINFNHSSEILGIASSSVHAAVKLVHFPSGTVFANFPGVKSNLGNVSVLEFSPNSGFLALGCKGKEVPIYRLKHFSNY